MHYIDIDQIIGDKYIVMVHGPRNPLINPAVAPRATEAVRRRLMPTNPSMPRPRITEVVESSGVNVR